MPVAVITGASRGLGLALARELDRRGWSLVLDARHEDDLAAAVARLDAGATPRDRHRPLTLPARFAATGHNPGLEGAKPGTRRHRAIAGDVTDDWHRMALVTAAADLGGADAVVNNASTLGASPLPAFADLTAATYARILAVNLIAPMALTRELLPQLREHRGRVVNISSDAAVEAYETWGGYASAKAALDHATRVLAVEEPLLTVSSIDPGDMRTAMHQDAFPGEDISDRPVPETVAPAVVRLLTDDLPSARYRASDLLRTEVPA